MYCRSLTEFSNFPLYFGMIFSAGENREAKDLLTRQQKTSLTN